MDAKPSPDNPPAVSDTPTDWQSQREWVELQFLERERRLPFVILNVFHHYRGSPAHRGATLRALGWYLLSRSAPVAAVSGVGIIGIVGLMLAWQANLLVHQQIERLDVQTHLNEAQRRSSLNFELSNILASLGEQKEPTPALKARIAALSASLRPYYFVSYGRHDRNGHAGAHHTWIHRLAGMDFLPPAQIMVPALETTPLSPERAQLLRSLASLGVSVESLSGATFAYADFSRTVLRDVSLGGTDLSSASFFGSTLRNVTLGGQGETTDLASADFSCSTLRGVILRGSSLQDAKFDYVNLSSLNLLGDKPDVHVDELLRADLRRADLHGVQIPTHRAFEGLDGFAMRWSVVKNGHHWRIVDRRKRDEAEKAKETFCR
jgi:hypothetical protein